MPGWRSSPVKLSGLQPVDVGRVGKNGLDGVREHAGRKESKQRRLHQEEHDQELTSSAVLFTTTAGSDRAAQFFYYSGTRLNGKFAAKKWRHNV